MPEISQCYPYKWGSVHSFLNGEYFFGEMEFTFLSKILREAMEGEKFYYLQPVGGCETQKIARQTFEFRKRLNLSRLEVFLGGVDYATYGSASICTNPSLICIRFSSCYPENTEITGRVEEVLRKRNLLDR